MHLNKYIQSFNESLNAITGYYLPLIGVQECTMSPHDFAKEPGKDCWVEASHHVWIGEREAATNAVP